MYYARVRIHVERLLESLGIVAQFRGDEWWAICPNPAHDDRKPSWRIVDDPSSERHGKHYCFPCGLGGDAIELVKVRLGIGTYRAALSWIEEFALVEDDRPLEAKVEVVSYAFRFPPGVERSDILTWPAPFRRYLAKRKLTLSQVRRWGLSYALEGRLSGRIVIPTRSASGRLLSYTARAIGVMSHRYLTPGRDEHADMSAVFGEEHWGPEGGIVLVWEGAFNALAGERALPEYPFAVLGTGGVSHANDLGVREKLRSFDGAIVVTDADAAGDKAFADVTAGLAGKWVARARPPEGVDADEMEPAALRHLVEGAFET